MSVGTLVVDIHCERIRFKYVSWHNLKKNQSGYESWGKSQILSLGWGKNLGDVDGKRVKTGVFISPVIIRV